MIFFYDAQLINNPVRSFNSDELLVGDVAEQWAVDGVIYFFAEIEAV